MKKLILTLAILVSGVSIYAVNNVITDNEVLTITENSEFQEISLDQLNEAIVNALQKDYGTATLSKAFVNESEQYKLIVTVEESEQTLYIDKDGNWLEESDIVEKK